MRIGANFLDDGRCEFVVWAPLLKKVELKILPFREKTIPMEKYPTGYWKTTIEGANAQTLYLYRLESDRNKPDPASYFQPQGVHGPSEVVDHKSFSWEDVYWRGISLSDMIIYELHVGTFTPQGTFEAIIPRLDNLGDLGINALEIMPVAQFPGERNWGYDGVYPFAVQNVYGGPEGLKRFVNACHQKRIAVILDVVYNHIGPEGNYLWEFGPYFSDKYKTPWGKAMNFDSAYSNDVRNFFIENALYWFKNYHIDALRLDAIHGIFDMSAKPFLQELAERVESFSAQEGKKYYLIAESDLNDVRVIRPREIGGYGIDAQWNDDFHHSLHALLTGENQGYYMDFGKIEHLIKSIREGFVYSGQYSLYRKRNYGNSAQDRPASQFVVFSQNHDQIGNRMFGERLSNLCSFETLKLAAGIIFLSPYLPLLFMGEEYGEDTPFLYFVSHSAPELIEAVKKGRKEGFEAFCWKGEPPDPQSVETFLKSKLNWEKRREGKHKVLMDFYKNLINMRKKIPALSDLDKNNLEVSGFENKNLPDSNAPPIVRQGFPTPQKGLSGERVIFMRRWREECESHIFCIFNLNEGKIRITVPLLEGRWKKLLDSSDKIWVGPGTLLPQELDPGGKVTLGGHCFAVYSMEKNP